MLRTFHRAAAIVLLALTACVPTPALAQSFSDYLENRIVDWLLRGEALTPPATVYVGLATSACSDSSIGTEVSAGGYARAAVTSSLANWAGTQSAGSTTASSGTGGQTSNNGSINLGTASADWGTVTHWFLIDAASGSTNLLFCAALTSSRSITTGAVVSFSAGALTITLQ
jgi:hypothetical protein